MLRDLCIAHPSFNIYHDVSHLLLGQVNLPLIRKKPEGSARDGQKILFGVIVFMFSLSAAYLAVSIADLIILIKIWYRSRPLRLSRYQEPYGCTTDSIQRIGRR